MLTTLFFPLLHQIEKPKLVIKVLVDIKNEEEVKYGLEDVWNALVKKVEQEKMTFQPDDLIEMVNHDGR